MSNLDPIKAEAISARNRAAKIAIWGGQPVAAIERPKEQSAAPAPSKALLPRDGGVTVGAAPRKDSKIEMLFAEQLKSCHLPAAERNFRGIPGRKFEYDFAYPRLKLAAEIQGMAHRIKENFERDIEKRALAQQAGWIVMEFSGKSIRDGRAIQWFLVVYERLEGIQRYGFEPKSRTEAPMKK